MKQRILRGNDWFRVGGLVLVLVFAFLSTVLSIGTVSVVKGSNIQEISGFCFEDCSNLDTLNVILPGGAAAIYSIKLDKRDEFTRWMKENSLISSSETVKLENDLELLIHYDPDDFDYGYSVKLIAARTGSSFVNLSDKPDWFVKMLLNFSPIRFVN